MNKSLATCCAVLALLMGCGNDEARTVDSQVAPDDPGTSTDDPLTNLECRSGDADLSSYPAFSPQGVAHVPFQCLEFADARQFGTQHDDYHIVDIEPGDGSGGASSGVLRIALHEIKTKAFLKGRKIAIVSNGKRFGAIERECAAIRAGGVEEVVALLDTKSVPGEQAVISARDFVAERPYGIWRVENRTSNAELESAWLVDSAGIDAILEREQRRAGSNAPVRTLVVVDSDDETNSNSIDNARSVGYVFVLEGGLEGLREFEMQATAMARAQARPRIGERGCRG